MNPDVLFNILAEIVCMVINRYSEQKLDSDGLFAIFNENGRSLGEEIQYLTEFIKDEYEYLMSLIKAD